VAFAVCEESGQYYRVMPRSYRMPVRVREWW
jgi:hypothetical protein